MPELPEVETVVDGLRERLAGARLRRVRVNDPRVLEAHTTPARLRSFVGDRLRTVGRRGKYILWRFERGTWIQHLRMTGKMLPLDSSRVPPHLRSEKSPSKQLRFFLEFDAGEWVFYDARRFGTLAAPSDCDAYFADRRLAPEIFADDDGDAALEHAKAHFVARATRGERAVKAVLLDQTAILGVGNIYADEALFRVGLHPTLPARRLRPQTAAALFDAAVAVMREALAKRGTSMADYLDVNGNPGVFKKYLNVYGRGGLACRNCDTSLQTIVVAGRTSHFCPRCQGRPRARRV